MQNCDSYHGLNKMKLKTETHQVNIFIYEHTIKYTK